MRKLYMFLALAGMLFATSASAGVSNLLKQDFESGTDPIALGWASPNLATGMSITGDAEGNYFQFSLGQNNGRSCNWIWGSDIYNGKVNGGNYHMELEWCYKQGSNNQYGTQFRVVSSESAPQGNTNDLSKGNWLFAITEVDDTRAFYVNDDTNNTFMVTIGEWMKISLDVDINARTVAYTVSDIFGNATYAEGTRTVPEEESMFATGINQHLARYQSIVQMDNIKVQVITDYDVANPPTVALTGVNGNERTYSISFGEEEELTIKGTDGKEETFFYMDCDGKYVYTTTTSGTLEAWTVSGSATSEVVSTEVECVPIALPGATATIIDVTDGYSKSYRLTVSNSDVPTQPTIFINYEFKNENGTVEASGTDKYSGEVVSVSGKGTLTVTTLAPGFTETTVTIQNDKEFATTNDIDIQHLTAEDLLAKGFEAMDPLDSSSTSGETNWTGRMRMYYQVATGEVDEEGNPTYSNVPVYGPSESGYEPIQRYRFLQSKLNEETAHQLFAPLYTWYGSTGATPKAYFEEDGVTPLVDDAGNPGGTTNLQVKLGIGLVFSGQVNDNENYNPNNLSYSPILINYTTFGVDGLTDDDFIVVYKIDNYGGGSIHPQYPAGIDPEVAKEQYKAEHLGGIVEVYTGLQTFQLYRVDTALSRVCILKTTSDGIEEVGTGKLISDHNAPVYNLNGIQVNPNSLKQGIYIKQGKKFIVR